MGLIDSLNLTKFTKCLQDILTLIYKIEAIQFSMKQMDGFIILDSNLENILKKKKENV